MPRPYSLFALYVAFAFATHQHAAADESAYEPDFTRPCADSSYVPTDFHEENSGGWGQAFGGSGQFMQSGLPGQTTGEDCDPEESGLFSRRTSRQDSPLEPPSSGHASYALSRAGRASTRSVIRHRAAHDGWSHVVEVRGDSLVRRRLGWTGGGWRVAAGDMTDTALRLAPRALPRRALPAGFVPFAPHTTHMPAGHTPAATYLSSVVPQGIAAGVFQPTRRAYALRTWNPVVTAREPPWHAPWNLYHDVAGVSVALPWVVSLHATTTRVTRTRQTHHTPKTQDSVAHERALAERTLIAGLQSPARAVEVLLALTENDLTGTHGVFWSTELEHRIGKPRASRTTLSLTFRQRTGGWVSAWDPAFTANRLQARFSGAQSGADTAEHEWGAGEARFAAHWVDPRGGPHATLPTRVSGESWRVWNPDAGTARQGIRTRVGWTLDEARLDISMAHRTARSASGSTSLYRYVQADARSTDPSRARVTAWRAWNAEGPTRAGLFLGAEPSWKTPWPHGGSTWSIGPGFKVEVGPKDELETVASLTMRARAGAAWSVSAGGELPCWPRGRAGEGRWNIGVSVGR
jgi:hypothetical protein